MERTLTAPNNYCYPCVSPLRKTEEIKWIGSPRQDGSVNNRHQRNRSNVSQISLNMQWPEKEEKLRQIDRRNDKNTSHFKIFGGPVETAETFEDLKHVHRLYKNKSSVRLDFSTEDRRKTLDPETYISKAQDRIL